LIIGVLLSLWWKDVLRESIGGYHTVIVQKGITIGFLLFLITEIMCAALRRNTAMRVNEQGERKRNHGRSLVSSGGENRKGDVSNMCISV
jgi:Cytochrome c oxidase subunit III